MKGNLMKTKLVICILGLMLIECSGETPTKYQSGSTEIAFVLCEGNMHSNNSTLHTLSEEHSIMFNTGDTGSSMAIYQNQLLVVNNITSNIVIYKINQQGIIETSNIVIDLNASSPREIIIQDSTAYVTQWLTHSVAVIDLTTLEIKTQIEMPGSTEGITTDGTYLYVTVKYIDTTGKWPYPAGNTIEKINITSNLVEDSFQVSENPELLIYYNGFLFVGSQSGWPAIHKIDKVNSITGEIILQKVYDSEIQLGIDWAIHTDILYRTYNNGIVSINEDLTINESTYISSEQLGLYSMAINNDYVYLGFSDDNTAPDFVRVLDFDGNKISEYEIGDCALPGSFAFWNGD